jgi:hypothetical protein
MKFVEEQNCLNSVSLMVSKELFYAGDPQEGEFLIAFALQKGRSPCHPISKRCSPRPAVGRAS